VIDGVLLTDGFTIELSYRRGDDGVKDGLYKVQLMQKISGWRCVLIRGCGDPSAFFFRLLISTLRVGWSCWEGDV
jgi:hypothetical protein